MVADTDVVRTITGAHKPFCKSFCHFMMREGNTGPHIQVLGIGKPSYGESGQPPVPSPYVSDSHAFSEKVKGKSDHVFILHALENRIFPFGFRYNSIRVIDSYFSAGIDALLAFPEFYQPGSAIIIKINGKAIKNHMKRKRGLVV